MKKSIILLAALLALPNLSNAAKQTWTSGEQLSSVRTKILANDTELYGYKVSSGSVSGNTLTLTLANASTIAVDVESLVNTDAQTITNLSLNATTNVLTVALSGGNTATVDLTGLITKALTVDASGFNGNLATTDDTLQEVAQKVDDLVIGSGGSMTWPSVAGIPYWTSGTAWGGSYTIDTDLSSVSASDDTIPSAKATKSALDGKLPLSGGALTGTLSFGVASTTTGLENFYNSGAVYPTGLYSLGASVPSVGLRLPGTMPTGNSTFSVDTNGYMSFWLMDTDLASVSASDDTVPSAKATKAALDGKQAALTNPVVQANLGTGMYTFLGTPSGANLAATLTTSLPTSKGGTGVANGSNNTITFTGNYTFGATLSGNTSVTFPTSGTLLTTAGSAASLTSFPTLNQNTTGTAANLSGTPALPNGVTATTQSAGDNSTKVATTAYVNALLPGGSDGTNGLLISNNTTRTPTATSDELYPEANVWKVNQNGTESSIAIGPTGTQINFSGTLTDTKYCTYGTGGIITCNSTPAGGLASTDIDTSLEIKNIVTDETGSGALTFATSPAFTTDIHAATAGGATAGTNALPFSGVRIGNAATNNILLTGTAASDVTVTLPSTTSTIATLGANTFTGTQALGANSLTMTGSIAATGARVTKGWFTDIESTNAPTVGGVAVVTVTGTQNIATTGTIQGGIVMNTDANGMTGAEMTTAGMYGTLFIATGSGTWTLPTAVAGMSGCLKDTGTSHDLILDVQAADNIQIPGAAEQADGIGVTNAATATIGDMFCFAAISAGHWVKTGSEGAWVSQ